MPLHWFIDPRLQLVTVVAEGDVRREDIDAYIDAMESAGAIGYRKLYDGLHGSHAMQSEELLEIGARFRGYHRGPVGAVALVLPEDRIQVLSALLGVLASADRPMRLFRTRHEAQKWLDSFTLGF